MLTSIIVAVFFVGYLCITLEDVLKVKRTIEDLRPSLRDETIIYDLSPNHIINYSPKDYEEIYRAF